MGAAMDGGGGGVAEDNEILVMDSVTKGEKLERHVTIEILRAKRTYSGYQVAEKVRGSNEVCNKTRRPIHSSEEQLLKNFKLGCPAHDVPVLEEFNDSKSPGEKVGYYCAQA